MTNVPKTLIAATVLAAAHGCGGDARLQLSAADVLCAVAGQMRTTLDEYHAELDAGDDRREAQAVSAFVARLRADADDDARLAAHTGQFTAALKKLRDDRRVEWQRRRDADDNVAVLHETAGGLQKLAVQSLSLQDEVKRYVTDLLATKSQTATRTEADANAR